VKALRVAVDGYINIQKHMEFVGEDLAQLSGTQAICNSTLEKIEEILLNCGAVE
jgi:hypothetical protein